MNSSITASSIWIRFSTSSTSTSFHPENATWTICPSYTYAPHSNKCGPRTLLVLTILAFSPNPNTHALIPYMHCNLSQISRWWVAKVITNQIFGTNVFSTDYNQLDVVLPFSWNQPANSAHLAPLNLIEEQKHLDMSPIYFDIMQEGSSTIPILHNPINRTIKCSHPITLESKRGLHPVTAKTSSLPLQGNMTQTPCQ
jgi:hypothetical protein